MKTQAAKLENQRFTQTRLLVTAIQCNILGCQKDLEELHVILESDYQHKKVFPDVPMIGFKINKNLKAHLRS